MMLPSMFMNGSCYEKPTLRHGEAGAHRSFDREIKDGLSRLHPETDLAVLRLSGSGFEYARFASSSALRATRRPSPRESSVHSDAACALALVD
jgi:hypothetical protein